MAHLKPVPQLRRVRCQGRRIHFDQAVWFMDKQLFRKASVADSIHHLLRLYGGRHPHFRLAWVPHPQDQVDAWAQLLWDEYVKLHQSRYNETFDPPLPDIPLTEEEYWREHVDNFGDFDDVPHCYRHQFAGYSFLGESYFSGTSG